MHVKISCYHFFANQTCYVSGKDLEVQVNISSRNSDFWRGVMQTELDV